MKTTIVPQTLSKFGTGSRFIAPLLSSYCWFEGPRYILHLYAAAQQVGYIGPRLQTITVRLAMQMLLFHPLLDVL